MTHRLMGEGFITFLLVQKSEAKRHAKGGLRFPPFNKLKDANLCFNQFYLQIGKIFQSLVFRCRRNLLSLRVLLNQRVEHFGGQFSRFGVLLDYGNPFFSVGSGLLSGRKLCFKPVNIFN